MYVCKQAYNYEYSIVKMAYEYICMYMMIISNNTIFISSNSLHWNSVNWKKWPYWEKENANSSHPFLIFNQSSSGSLAELIGQEWEKKVQVTSGNSSVLQSIIGTSERLIAETICPVYYCADNLKLSSCATESHWKGFWQPDPSSCVSPKITSKRWMRKYNNMKNWKIRTWVCVTWK